MSCCTSRGRPAGHPFATFTRGHAESLRHGDASAVAAVKALYRDHYHASNMKLCLVAPAALDETEAWCRESFARTSAPVWPSNFEVCEGPLAPDGIYAPACRSRRPSPPARRARAPRRPAYRGAGPAVGRGPSRSAQVVDAAVRPRAAHRLGHAAREIALAPAPPEYSARAYLSSDRPRARDSTRTKTRPVDSRTGTAASRRASWRACPATACPTRSRAGPCSPWSVDLTEAGVARWAEVVGCVRARAGLFESDLTTRWAGSRRSCGRSSD